MVKTVRFISAPALIFILLPILSLKKKLWNSILQRTDLVTEAGRLWLNFNHWVHILNTPHEPDFNEFRIQKTSPANTHMHTHTPTSLCKKQFTHFKIKHKV